MIKRQYNNNVISMTTSRSTYLISMQFNGFTAAGKNRYRIGIIDTNNTKYLHEKVFHTTSYETQKAEAARVLAYYEDRLKA